MRGQSNSVLKSDLTRILHADSGTSVPEDSPTKQGPMTTRDCLGPLGHMCMCMCMWEVTWRKLRYAPPTFLLTSGDLNNKKFGGLHSRLLRAPQIDSPRCARPTWMTALGFGIYLYLTTSGHTKPTNEPSLNEHCLQNPTVHP